MDAAAARFSTLVVRPYAIRKQRVTDDEPVAGHALADVAIERAIIEGRPVFAAEHEPALRRIDPDRVALALAAGAEGSARDRARNTFYPAWLGVIRAHVTAEYRCDIPRCAP